MFEVKSGERRLLRTEVAEEAYRTALACALLAQVYAEVDEITITWLDGEVSIDLFVEDGIVVNAAGNQVWPL